MASIQRPGALALGPVFNRPVALDVRQAEVFRAIAQGRLQASNLYNDDPEDRRIQLDLVDGVAIIPVCGCLTNDGWGWYDETRYDAIRRAFNAAVGDDMVRAIALHVNSPGGEVAGVADLADAVYAARGNKPVWAILDENAFSAAYWLASACDRITVPRTGGTGSIGVITMHVDITQALEQSGVVVTTIQYGARKSDGYPTTKLSKEALAALQADVDTIGELFVDTVARNRGVAASKIRATEAETYLGAAGVDLGLADEVSSCMAAFTALCQSVA